MASPHGFLRSSFHLRLVDFNLLCLAIASSFGVLLLRSRAIPKRIFDVLTSFIAPLSRIFGLNLLRKLFNLSPIDASN